MAAKRGRDFKLYRNTDDPYDSSPTWSEVTNVRDLSRSIEKLLANASIRGSEWVLQVATQKQLEITFQMVYDPDDTHYDAMETAFYDDAIHLEEFLILDGPIGTVGSKGLRVHAEISNFSVNEALEDVGLTDVTLVPGYAPTNLPRRVHVVTAGSVVDQ